MTKNIIIGLLILIPIIVAPVVYFQHDRIENLFSSQTVDWNSLVKRNGLYYQKFTEEPFTGKVTGEQRGKIANGKTDGTFVVYRADCSKHGRESGVYRKNKKVSD